MAPAPSKFSTTNGKSPFKIQPSNAKKFLDRHADVPEDVLKNIVSSHQRSWIGEMNKALMDAEKKRLCAMLGSYILGQVGDDRVVTPIVGRGKGKDTVYTSFYRGDGDKPVSVKDMKHNEVAYFPCGKLYEAAVEQFQGKIDDKVKAWKADNPNHVPSEVHTPKKAKTTGGVMLKDVHSINDMSSTDTDNGVAKDDGAWLSSSLKAELYTRMNPTSTASDAEKAALFDAEAAKNYGKK